MNTTELSRCSYVIRITLFLQNLPTDANHSLRHIPCKRTHGDRDIRVNLDAMANSNNNSAPHQIGFYLQRVGSKKNEIIPLREGVHRVGRSSKADVVIRSRFCNRNLGRIIITAQTVTVEIEVNTNVHIICPCILKVQLISCRD